MWSGSSCRKYPASPSHAADAWACSKVSVNLLKDPRALADLRSKLENLRTSRAFPGLAEALGMRPSSCLSLPEDDASSMVSGEASKKQLLKTVELMMAQQLKKGLPADSYVSSDEGEDDTDDDTGDDTDDEEEGSHIAPEELSFSDFTESPSENGGSEEEDLYIVEEAVPAGSRPSSLLGKVRKELERRGELTNVADVDPAMLQKALKVIKPTFSPASRRNI